MESTNKGPYSFIVFTLIFIIFLELVYKDQERSLVTTLPEPLECDNCSKTFTERPIRPFKLRRDNRIPTTVATVYRNASRVIPTTTVTHASVKYSDCTSAELMPPKSLPPIALTSFPGSGNTWVRYLIERATGIYTGSVYNDGGLYKGGFRGEMLQANSGRTIVIKTHSSKRNQANQNIRFKGAIFIIRNPYNAVIAENNRQNSKSHVNLADESLFKGKAWDSFGLGMIKRWENICVTIQKQYKNLPVLIVFYEDLLASLHTELKKIVEFLHVQYDEKRLACTEAYPEGQFKRKHKRPIRGEDVFSQLVIDEFNKRIKHCRQALRTVHTKTLPMYEL